MDKKLYTEKKVKPCAVSFIIGKNGCHIKEITNRIKNGAYVEYQIDEHKFIVSAYSKDSLTKLVESLDKLEREFDTNRKKYAEYKFVNRFVDHALVTEIIQSLKTYNHSSFAEYKGDNIFMLSNYSMDILQTMIDHIKKYDIPIPNLSELMDYSDSIMNKNYNQWLFKRDYTRVMEEVIKLNASSESHTHTHARNMVHTEGISAFRIAQSEYIETNALNTIIDNYVEIVETISEISLSKEDVAYIQACETEFVDRCKTHVNPYYQLSRDYVSSRRISDL